MIEVIVHMSRLNSDTPHASLSSIIVLVDDEGIEKSNVYDSVLMVKINLSQLVFTCSEFIIETPEQCVKFV